MLKETIKYTDYNGTVREEDFYFNLTASEVIEMSATAEGDLAESLKRIVASNDGGKIMMVFKDLLRRSYGEKSADGRHFEKSDAISKAFFETEAYNVLFLRMVTNPDYAAQFISGVLPKEIPEPGVATK